MMEEVTDGEEDVVKAEVRVDIVERMWMVDRQDPW